MRYSKDFDSVDSNEENVYAENPIRALDNPVLRTEGRVTMIDGILAVAVLAGLVLNATLGWWWADPAAGYVLVYYAAREVQAIFSPDH